MFDLKTYYQNFSLDNPTVSLTVIVWAICIGLAIGTVFYTLAKHSSGKLIDSLMKKECFTKDQALSLSKLSVKPSRSLKKALRDDATLRKYVFIANADECRIEQKKNFFHKLYRFFRGEDVPASYDLDKALLYLPEEGKYTASVRYENKGYPFVTAAVACVLFLLAALGISFCLPKLLELVDSMITAYKNL